MTRETALTRAPERLPKKSSGSRKVDHLWWVPEGRVALEMGVQVRALCGFWIWPGTQAVEGVKSTDGGDLGRRRCKRCNSVLARYERTGMRWIR